MARVRNTGSSLAWYFSWMALTDSASMRAWAGSYTPQGRSQCAVASTVENMGEKRLEMPPDVVGRFVWDPTRGDQGRQIGRSRTGSGSAAGQRLGDGARA